MGYNTDFSGYFELSPPLTEEQVNIVKAFTNLICWCQWTVSDDGKIFRWDGSSKFHDYIDWMHYLYYMFFSKWQVSLEGCISWEGDNDGDEGTITATPFLGDDGVRRTRFTVVSEKGDVAGHQAKGTGSESELPAYMQRRKKNESSISAANVANAASPAKKNFPKAAVLAFEDLPMEIVARIACFMDVEEVMRFRAVSKLTNACCTSGEFLGQWCEHWKQKKLGRLLFTECHNLGEQKKFPRLSRLVLAPGYTSVSSSGGLVCCCNGNKNSIVVGNPLTKQWLELPPCPLVKLSKWHLISYPEEDDTGGVFFVVVDATCKCWFSSKLGTWNLGEGVYNFAICSVNVLRFGEDGRAYALVELPWDGYEKQKGLVQLDLEDVAASKLLCSWKASSQPFTVYWHDNGAPFEDYGPLVLLEHKGKVVLKNQNGFWALEQSSWRWEQLCGDDDDDEVLLEWQQLQAPICLSLDITLACPRMNKDVDKQCCTSKYWAS